MDNSESLILIVDDQRDNLDAILGYLRESNKGYKFLQATTGEMAIKVATKRLPDLIIMDWEMPVMNGVDALIALKKQVLTKDIPVVMATGRTSSEDLGKALSAGASDYIRKPIEEPELLTRVNTCLSINRLLKETKLKNEVLEDMSREKDGMISIVAHDLRAPLNNIKGLNQLLSMVGDLNEEQKEFVSKIDRVVKRGSDLIRDILDINSVKNAASDLEMETIDLNDFVEEWKNGYDQGLSAKNQKLVLTGEIGGLSIKTDKGILIRILDNIFTNAMKFSAPGASIFFHIANSDKHIKFNLRDEGPGISAEDQKKMFKPFTKLSAVPTAGESSNGLGLSIIKALVNELGGKLSVQSELSKGTSFEVSLLK